MPGLYVAGVTDWVRINSISINASWNCISSSWIDCFTPMQEHSYEFNFMLKFQTCKIKLSSQAAGLQKFQSFTWLWIEIRIRKRKEINANWNITMWGDTCWWAWNMILLYTGSIKIFWIIWNQKSEGCIAWMHAFPKPFSSKIHFNLKSALFLIHTISNNYTVCTIFSLINSWSKGLIGRISA